MEDRAENNIKKDRKQQEIKAEENKEVRLKGRESICECRVGEGREGGNQSSRFLFLSSL